MRKMIKRKEATSSGCSSNRNYHGLPVLILLIMILMCVHQSRKELQQLISSTLGSEVQSLRDDKDQDLNSTKAPDLRPVQQVQDQALDTALSRSRWRHETICNRTGTRAREEVWAKLCQGGFLLTVDQILRQSGSTSTGRVVQIGAHVGFEDNDPLARGISSYLELLTPQERQRFQWTFVEPSTANYRSLQTNLADHSQWGADLRSINAGVVPDSTNTTTDMTFYSIRDTIDPVTGFDSLSNKRFPVWITQISSFSMAPINFNRRVWERMGLNMDDYVVQTNVTTRRYSDLMDEILDGDDPATSLALVLIDTEGFDCHIVNGIAKDSPYLPQFLVFEQKQCRSEKAATLAHLQSMGYEIHSLREDIVAFKQP